MRIPCQQNRKRCVVGTYRKVMRGSHIRVFKKYTILRLLEYFFFAQVSSRVQKKFRTFFRSFDPPPYIGGSYFIGKYKATIRDIIFGIFSVVQEEFEHHQECKSVLQTSNRIHFSFSFRYMPFAFSSLDLTIGSPQKWQEGAILGPYHSRTAISKGFLVSSKTVKLRHII